MAKQKNSNKGWIIGSVLGAISGAAYALWKTPMSGQQVRNKIAPGTTTRTAAGTSSNGFTGTVMNKVEHTLAPIVGVKLGQTAHKTGDAEAVRVSDTTVYTADSASTGSTTLKSEPESITEKRWAWGSPAPERDETLRNDVEDSRFQAAETAHVEPNLPEAAPEGEADPVVASSSNATPAFGDDAIRQRRFGWGDPAPETTTAPPATEFTNVPSANAVMPEQTPAGASVVSPDANGVTTTTGTAGINPEHTSRGSSLTTPSPQQRVVSTSASDATSPIGETAHGGGHNVDDNVLFAASGHSTGRLNPFPKLGGLED